MDYYFFRYIVKKAITKTQVGETSTINDTTKLNKKSSYGQQNGIFVVDALVASF